MLDTIEKARIQECRLRHPDKPDIVIVNSLKKNYFYTADEAWEIVDEHRARYLPAEVADREKVVELRKQCNFDNGAQTLGDILARALALKNGQPKLLIVYKGLTTEYRPTNDAESQRVIALVKAVLGEERVEVYMRA